MEEIKDLDRVVYLCSDINSEGIKEVMSQLLHIINMDKQGMETFRNYKLKPIYLYVQSFGGSVYDMFALIDIIESSTTPIMTICTGYCMSAAALIFMAGHARYMFKNSTLMLHQMSSIALGKINDLVLDVKEQNKLHKKMMKFIKKHSDLPKKYLKHIDGDKQDVYLSAKNCIKYGICDEIFEKSGIREQYLQLLQEEPEQE